MAGAFLQTIFDEVRQALDRGDTDLAIGIARHTVEHAPAVIEGHRLLGEAYLNAAQFEPACAAFENVLRADPEHIAAYYGLGLAQRSLNRTSQAIHALERALEIQPNLAELRTQLLQLYELTPNSAGQFRLSRSGLGRLYARGQMYTQAIDEYRAVLDNEPDRDDIRVALAETLWRDGQEDAAVEWCRQTVEAKPDLFKPTLILGYLQLAAGQPEGEALWRRAAAQEPTLATAETLFDVLPPVQIDEPTIPAFDEDAWRASNAAQPQATPAVAPTPADTQSDDDLLASLLGFGFDADPVPAEPRASVAVDAMPDEAPAAYAAPSDAAPESEAAPAEVVAAEPSRAQIYDAPTSEPEVVASPPEPVVVAAPTTGRANALSGTSTPDDLPGADAQPYPMFRRPQWSASTSFGRVEPFRLEDWDSATRDDEDAVVASNDAATEGTLDAAWFARDDATPPTLPSDDQDTAEEAVTPAAYTEPDIVLTMEPVAETEADTAPVASTDTETTPAAATEAESTSEPMAVTSASATSAPQPVAATEDTAPATVPVAQVEQPSVQSTPPTAAPADPYPGVKPFSLADLDDEPFDDDRASFEFDTSDDVRPFSLRELGLEQNATADMQKPSVPGYIASDAPTARDNKVGGNLGLSDDDLTAWELAARNEAMPYEPPVYDTPTPAQEPVTPFSLADLGLSDEEMERWSVDAPLSSAARPAPEEEATPFSLADFEPTPSTPTPAFVPTDPAVHEAETQPFDVSALLGDTTTAEQPANEPAPTPEPTLAPTPERSAFQRFHEQLEINPDNHVLRLALARAFFRQHDIDHAFEQYRQLVQRDALFEPVLEDLNDILSSTEDRSMLRRVHKLIGDVYMAQGRTDEALEAYSWT